MQRTRFILTLVAAAMLPQWAIAQSKPPIKIGYISILTGPLAGYGKAQELMVKLAVEDVNAKGGINGSLLQVDSVDATLDPGQAVVMFRKFLGEGHFGVIGPMTGTQWETVSALANQLNMPAITATASKPGITIRPWTIRMQPPDDIYIGEGFASFAKLNPNVKSVVITADVREASGKAGAEAFEALAKKAGWKVLGVAEFSTRATDLSPVAIQIKGLNPDAVLVSALGPNALQLAKEFKTQNITVPVLANSLIWPGPVVNTVGDAGRNWHTIGFTTPTSSTGDNALNLSAVKRFQERADASLGKPANSANWSLSYDTVLAYADMMRNAKIDGNTDPKVAREAIKNEFMKIKTFKGIQSYVMRDTGDMHIPGRALVADTTKNEWRFADK